MIPADTLDWPHNPPLTATRDTITVEANAAPYGPVDRTIITGLDPDTVYGVTFDRWNRSYAVSSKISAEPVRHLIGVIKTAAAPAREQLVVVSRSRGLSFRDLSLANTLRLPTFKNAKGEPAHSEPDGSDWCLAQWCNAVCGELGELANLIKKVERGDLTLDEARPALGKECADIVTYLDILSQRIGVDLGAETLHKFNEVSVRVGSPVLLVQLADGGAA
jgi:NTP pyrophosphatase (non-canonical NTP hydrolase)